MTAPTPTEECEGAPELQTKVLTGGELEGQIGALVSMSDAISGDRLLVALKELKALRNLTSPEGSEFPGWQEGTTLADAYGEGHADGWESRGRHDALLDHRRAVGSAPLADTGGSMPSNSSPDPVRAELLAALKEARQELYDERHSHMSEAEFANSVDYIDAAIARAERLP